MLFMCFFIFMLYSVNSVVIFFLIFLSMDNFNFNEFFFDVFLLILVFFLIFLSVYLLLIMVLISVVMNVVV